jgi:hypothetical protein
MPLELSWLSGNQLHRFEGIFIYFGFLLLLFMVTEKVSSKNASGLPPHASRTRADRGLFRKSFFPLLLYYATTLGIPLANGAYRGGIAATDFWQHSVFVLLTPLLLILPLAAFSFHRDHSAAEPQPKTHCG